MFLILFRSVIFRILNDQISFLCCVIPEATSLEASTRTNCGKGLRTFNLSLKWKVYNFFCGGLVFRGRLILVGREEECLSK